MLYTVAEIAKQLNLKYSNAYNKAKAIEPNAKTEHTPNHPKLYRQSTVNKIKANLELKQNYSGSMKAAEYLNISPSTIRYQIKHNLIKYDVINGKKYIHISTLKHIKTKLDKANHKIQKYNMKTALEIMKELNLTRNEFEQIVKKYEIVPFQPINDGSHNFYQLDIFIKNKEFIQKLVTKRKPHVRSKLNNDIDQTTLVPLPEASRKLNIKRKVLYAFISKGTIIAYKDTETKRLSLDTSTIEYLENNYLKYPNCKLYTTKQIVKLLKLSKRRINSLMYRGHIQYTQILGDPKYYLTNKDVKRIKELETITQTKQFKSQTDVLIKNTTKQKSKTDLSATDVANKLHAKKNHIESWAKHNLISYQYNGNTLFFTENDYHQIKQQYLNYPKFKLVNKGNALKLTNLTTNPPKFNRICDKLNIHSHHVLGDFQTFFNQKDIEKIQQYINNLDAPYVPLSK